MQSGREPETGSGEPGRLNSWKEIAHFLGASERTVQRWERQEGMPVHRHLHSRLSSIYAYRKELEAWLAKREAGRDRDSVWRLWLWAVGLAGLAAAAWWWLAR